MDTKTILAIVVLVAVLAYFVFIYDPKPPNPYPPIPWTPVIPVHPVEHMCIVNYNSIEAQILEKTNGMTTFWVDFVKKYGNDTPGGDPITVALNYLYFQVVPHPSKICDQYSALKPLVVNLMKSLSDGTNKNLIAINDGKHPDEVAILKTYFNFFNGLGTVIDTEIAKCCGVRH